MKKLLFFVVIIAMTSCTISLEDSKIKNPEKSTTVEIQNNIIDSCAVIATDGFRVYIVNKQTNLVEYELVPMDGDHEVVHIGFLIAFIIICFIIVILIIILVND